MVRSLWIRTGIIHIISGAVVAIAITPFWIWGLPSWLAELPFHRWALWRTMPDFVFVTLYIACAADFVLGLSLFALGHYREARLKRLKETGKAHAPIMIEVIPKGLANQRCVKAFAVKCDMRNSKGNEFVVNSGWLAVYGGILEVIPQSPDMACEATVYVNPKKSWDYAVDVVL